MPYFNLFLGEELHSKAKSKAALQKIPLQDFLKEAVEEKVGK